MRIITTLFVVFIALLKVNAAFCQSAPTKSQCIAEANVTYNQTLKLARETRNNAVFVCRAGSQERAACLISCLQNRSSCVKPIDDALRACYTAADNAFISGRESCRVAANCTRNCGGNIVYQTCMANVRVTLYNANRSCRLSDNKAGRKACRDNFKTCNNNCA
jgi:hypothetical protein